ncbi:hypothetical protein HYX10_01020 [Candidatus Woesearchaeota archaeon]|nr:hypothetical protein [Candidatus Woesearchaeota archaeon]
MTFAVAAVAVIIGTSQFFDANREPLLQQAIENLRYFQLTGADYALQTFQSAQDAGGLEALAEKALMMQQATNF